MESPAEHPTIPAVPPGDHEIEKRPQFVCSKQQFKEGDLNFKADDVSLQEARDRITITHVDPCQEGHPAAMVLNNVFSEAECQSVIQGAENLGFTFWDTTGQADVNYRSAYTIEIIHRRICDVIFERIQPWLATLNISPDDVIASRDFTGMWAPESGYENLLIGRYREGGHFSPHSDGTTYVDVNRRTVFTTLLYLKDTEEGGRTFLLKPESKEAEFNRNQRNQLISLEEHRVYGVVPKTGRLLVFYHEDMHEAEGVSNGHEKYIIRTDVVYKRTPEILTSESDQEAYKMWVEAQRLAEEDDNHLESIKLLKKAFAMSPGLSELMGMG